MNNVDFIYKISALIQAENEKRGNPLFSSVVIAQACLETGYGKSNLMMNANAIFGIKATSSWTGKVYSAKTKEVYNNNPVYIHDKFRAYNSLEESIADYFDLITKTSRYRKALTTETPLGCIEEIKKGGYATDPEYVRLVMNIIEKYNLQDFDKQIQEENKMYKIGQNYTLQVNLNVRNGAGIFNRKLNKLELTKNAQIHSDVFGVLKKGTIVTCLETKNIGSDIWLRIPSGWIAGFYGGKWYVK